MNVANLLIHSAEAQPDRSVLRIDDTVVSYAELERSSARFAALLMSAGVRAGDRVAIMLPNVAEFAVVYYGTLRLGAVAVPMNPLLKSREVRHYLADSGARALIVWHAVAADATAGMDDVSIVTVDPAGFGALLETFAPLSDVVQRAPSDTAVLLYTSGTTGRPKGAELTHSNLLRNVEVTLNDLMPLTCDDVVFGGLPLFHAFGQTCTLNTAVSAGASLLLLTRFDPSQAVQQLLRHHATVFAGVPTMYNAMLALADAPSLPALRLCVSGGAALPVEVLAAFEQRFATTVLEGYGLSETSPVASFNRSDGRKPGSIGTPVTGVEMRVIDAQGARVELGEVGEIAIRGHNVMKGYWNKPQETAAVLSEDGWFRTGDLGRVDEDGFFFIVGREKDLIIRGGFNVYPREIEELLYEHPAVIEAAVIGVPHPSLGEEIAAAVVVRSDAAITESELRSYVKRNVAPYKYPRFVWFLEALPKGPTGKIVKREIVPPAHITESETTS